MATAITPHRDAAERLTSRSLRTTGENIVAIATMLDGMDITKRERWEATYFDIGRVAALSYGMIVSWIIAAAALLFGAIAWVRVASAAFRLDGPLRWTFTAVWTVIGAAAAIAAMIAATWGLRAAREVYHPWYAHPDRLFFLLTVVGLSVAWGIARIGASLPASVRSVRDPLVVWSIALPIWIILAAAATWLAPSAAYLWTLPLLVASTLVFAAAPGRGDLVKILSVVVLAVAGTLWLRNTVDLLEFSTAVFGRLPIITPVYVYAAIIAAGGVMMMPPIVAITVRPAPVGRPAARQRCVSRRHRGRQRSGVRRRRTPMSDRFGGMCGHCRRRARRFQCGRWPPSNLASTSRQAHHRAGLCTRHVSGNRPVGAVAATRSCSGQTDHPSGLLLPMSPASSSLPARTASTSR